MPYITNPIFTEIEKAHLEFILSYDFSEKSDIIAQLNNVKEAEITRDITPYYWIMEFRPNGTKPGYDAMRPCIDIEVLHENGIAPTLFTLYIRNGHVFELEIHNADSSAIDLNSIMNGEILINPFL